jgi:hypothetical protein
LGESSFHRPPGRNGIFSLFDHAAHFVPEVYDRRSDNMTDLKSAILHGELASIKDTKIGRVI